MWHHSLAFHSEWSHGNKCTIHSIGDIDDEESRQKSTCFWWFTWWNLGAQSYVPFFISCPQNFRKCANQNGARPWSDLLASYILVSVVLVYSYSLYPLSTLSLSTIDWIEIEWARKREKKESLLNKRNASIVFALPPTRIKQTAAAAKRRLTASSI